MGTTSLADVMAPEGTESSLQREKNPKCIMDMVSIAGQLKMCGMNPSYFWREGRRPPLWSLVAVREDGRAGAGHGAKDRKVHKRLVLEREDGKARKFPQG